jgi:hypothetical protein
LQIHPLVWRVTRLACFLRCMHHGGSTETPNTTQLLLRRQEER